MITEEAEDSSEGTDRKAIGDEFYNSPGADEKIVIASLSVTVTGLLGGAGGGEARVGGGYHHHQQQPQQQQIQQQQQKEYQTQSPEEATQQEPAFKISPPASPSSNNNANSNNNNANNLPLAGNFPDQSSEPQLQLPFNPENGQLPHPLVSHSQGKMLSLVSPDANQPWWWWEGRRKFHEG